MCQCEREKVCACVFQRETESVRVREIKEIVREIVGERESTNTISTQPD